MKINRAFIKGTNWALAGLLGLLGFSCYEKYPPLEYGPLIVEYGVPNASFIVKGTVTDKITGNNIEGIQVTVPRVDHCQSPSNGYIPDRRFFSETVRDTTYTDDKGIFTIEYNGIQTNDSTNIIIIFEDITKNPIYQTDSTKVTFFQSDLQGGSGWYQGGASKEINIKLDQKSE